MGTLSKLSKNPADPMCKWLLPVHGHAIHDNILKHADKEIDNVKVSTCHDVE